MLYNCSQPPEEFSKPDKRYTGYEDKNNESIFEGNIVTRSYRTFTIIYEEENDRFMMRTVTGHRNILTSPNTLEIIGDIDTTPELLEI